MRYTLVAGLMLELAVSKSATIHLSKCLALACAPDITVNSIAPGLMNTDWVQGFTADQMKLMEDKSALGRIAEVDDVADAAISLMCNKSLTVKAFSAPARRIWADHTKQGTNLEVSAGYAM